MSSLKWLPTLFAMLLTACATTAKKPVPNRAVAPLPVEAVLGERLAAEFDRQAGDGSGQLAHLLSAARSSAEPEPARRALKVALQQGDNSAARELWSRWQHLQPEAPALRAWAIALALNQGQSERAWTLHQELAPPPLAVKDLAEALAAVPVRERVLPFIERSLAATDDVATAMRWVAFVQRLEEADMAMILAAGLIDRFPQNAQVWALRAGLKRDGKDLAGALEDYAEAFRLDPDSRFLRSNLAQLQDAVGDSAAAADLLAGIDPINDESVQAQAAYAARSADPVRMQSAYQALQTLPPPRLAPRLKMLGAMAELLSDQVAAVAWYRQVPSGPDRAGAILRAAVLLNDQGQLAAALSLIQELRAEGLSSREDLLNSYLVEGSLHANGADAKAALQVYDRALNVLPDESQLFYARALVNAAHDQIAAAEMDFRQVLAADPNDAAALNALGYTLADRTDRLDEALVLIERALQLQPDAAAIMDSMGWLRFRMGQLGQAVGYLKAAYAKQNDVEIAAHLGAALWVSGEHDQARQIWHEAQLRVPNNPVLRAILQQYGQQ